MQAIKQPIKRSKLISELIPERFIRDTNNGKNKIYVFTSNDSPNLMTEIGRLRELTFRAAGGGTGKEIDIDEFDLGEVPYKQLIVWNPEDEQIIGGRKLSMKRQSLMTFNFCQPLLLLNYTINPINRLDNSKFWGIQFFHIACSRWNIGCHFRGSNAFRISHFP